MIRLVHGVGSLLAMGLLIIGVPTTLVRFVGRPWPQSMPPIEIVVETIRAGAISDVVIIKMLAVIVWIAWIRLMLSLVIECSARVVGRTAPRVVGLGSSQRWAAALTAGVVLLLGVGARPAQAVSPAVEGSVRASAAASEPTTEHRMPHTPHRLAGTAESSVTHVVVRNESFWSIAEDWLGDGARWREIVDINRGVEVAPGVIFDNSPARLMPGWRLRLPDSARPGSTSSPTAQPSPASVGPASTIVVKAGDTLSDLAAKHLGSAAAWPALFEANRRQPFANGIIDDPNLIVPGWELVVPDALPLLTGVAATPEAAPDPMPPSPDTAASAPIEAAEPVTDDPIHDIALDPRWSTGLRSAAAVAVDRPVLPVAPLVSPEFGGAPASDDTAERDDERASTPDSSAPAGFGAGMLIAGGVIGVVASRRRRQLRASTGLGQIAPSSSVARATEAALRPLDHGGRVARIDVTLRAAAASMVANGRGAAIIGCVVSGDGAVDVLLSGVLPAPAPFVAVSGHCWRLEADTALDELGELARRVDQPCPALAHIGALQGGHGHGEEVFIDLEAVGLLCVDAPPAVAAGVVRAMANGVALSPLAEVAHLICVGVDQIDPDRQNATSASTTAAAIDVAVSTVVADVAAATTNRTTFQLRCGRQGGDAWEPAVIFAIDDAAPDDRELVALTERPGRGLAVVVGRPIAGATWRLEQRSTGWMLHPLGIEVTPVGMSAADVAHIRVLVEEADQPVQRTLADAGCPVDNDWRLMVRVLGPVSVSDRLGVDVRFERSKALELVCWLSQHRGRSTRSAARTALWELNVRDATFANVVSDARRSLARCASGSEWIPRSTTDQLSLHPGVVTDADLLTAALNQAKDRTPTEAIDIIRPALDLVRDLPFAGTSYVWADVEGITSQLTVLVTAASAAMAGHCLSVGDTHGVFWATGQGLRALPGHEELIALRMRAHARMGDLAAVRQEWTSYERVLASEPWGDGEPAPKLLTLRRELLTASTISGAAPS